MVRDYEYEIEKCIEKGQKVIEIVSYEKERVRGFINNVAMTYEAKWYSWSATKGVREWKDDLNGFKDANTDALTIQSAVEWFSKRNENAFILFENAHAYLDPSQPLNIQILDEAIDESTNGYKKAIFLRTYAQHIPYELTKDLPIIKVDLPDRETIEIIAEEVVAKYTKMGICMFADTHNPKILDSALGLTVMEARSAFAEAILENRQLTEEEIPIIIQQKERIINNSGLLEYFHPKEHLDSVGGLENLKDWIKEQGQAYSDEAQAYGFEIPRGVLLLGVPGCGKSLTAKAVANEWKFPLLRFDLGKVFGGLVGESEKNIRYALDIAKTISPCILWIDEIEKGLSGSQSSGMSDGGTSARVMGTFLTWMQEKTEPVFVIATANDISQLPAELLRKGRFDEIFFVDLPSAREREDIIKIHLKNKGRDVDALNLDMPKLVQKTLGFSGAEIEEVVKKSIAKAFVMRQKDIEMKNLLACIDATTPLSVTMKETIDGLRAWSSYRAVSASKEKSEEIITPNGDMVVLAQEQPGVTSLDNSSTFIHRKIGKA